MKYLVGLFYRNSLEYLKIAVQSVKPFWKHIVIIDNTPELSLRSERAFPEGVTIVEPPAPLTFTQSMNLIIRMAEKQGCDAVLFMHNDVQAHANAADRFLKTMNRLHRDGIHWGLLMTQQFLIVAQNIKMIREVGLWDTVWPDIFSDYDYCYRVYLSGYEILKLELPLTHHNEGGSTVKADLNLWSLTLLNAPMWHDYYQIKWGGDLLKETYRIPFTPASADSQAEDWSKRIRIMS